MTLEYNYDDPEKRWPCLGWMTVEELTNERTRCESLLAAEIKTDHDVPRRLLHIELETLSREYLRECHEQFIAGTRFPNGADFQRWLDAREVKHITIYC